MNGSIVTEHLASFSEKSGPLTFNAVKDKLRSNRNQAHEKSLQCCFNISAEKLLEVRFVNSGRPCEQFDIRLVTDIAAFASQESKFTNSFILVFRYLAKDLTDGSGYNEFHVFRLNSEADLLLAVACLKKEVDSMKHVSSRRTPQRRLLREDLKTSAIFDNITSSNTNEKPQKGSRNLLKKTNNLLEEIQKFESKLQSALSDEEVYEENEVLNEQVTIKQEDAANHIKCIRKGLNNLPELIDIVSKTRLETLARKLFTSLRWIRSVGESKKLHEIHPLLINYVKEPGLTDKTTQFLDRYLQKEDKAFWRSLGESWIVGRSTSQTSSMKSETVQGDTESVNSCSTIIPIPTRLTRRATGDDLFNEITAALPTSNPKTDLRSYATVSHSVNNGPKESFFASFTEENFINSIRHRGKLVAKIINQHVGLDRAELTVHVGDILEVLDYGEQWCCLRTSTALVGHVPVSCVRILSDDNETDEISEIQSSTSQTLEFTRAANPTMSQCIAST